MAGFRKDSASFSTDRLILYSNPAGEYITIYFNGINPTLKRVATGEAIVEIYDVMGVKIQKELIPNSALEIYSGLNQHKN